MGSTQAASRNDNRLKEPGQYRVILLNDDFTTMEFVVEILIVVFHKEEAEAARIMLDVHNKGRGMVGLYPFDIALTKTEQVHSLARQHDFPLRCLVERA
jgi:ATP-dependent Clp protease adaptor protein ClpS